MEFTRNDKVRNLIHKDGVKEDIHVHYPIRYETSELASSESTVGLVALVTDSGDYTVMTIPVMISFNTDSSSVVVIDEVQYRVLTIKKDTPLFKFQEYVDNADIPYILLDEWFTLTGNIPFYYTEDEILKIMLRCYDFTGAAISEDVVSMAILVSIISRDPETNDYYRQTDGNGLKFTGLKNKDTNYKNLASQIGTGVYLAQGIEAGVRLEDRDQSTFGKVLDT